MPNIELTNINKSYIESGSDNGIVLNNINLLIKDKEFLGILGPSGCGKTTLLKVIAGLIFVDSGEVFQDRESLEGIPVESRNFAMVSQQPLLFPNMNLLDNVAFGLKMKGIGKSKRYERAVKMLNILKLDGLEKRYPSQLSGGQCQRGAIARALVTKPSVLLMDEPFSSLNEELRLELRNFLKDLHKESGLTTILVTHDREEAEFLSDRIITMNNGCIL
ncbi:ABC transporter ATP-binding protein [Clostridium sp.]|uniref:ABC transporter ATP-binding protein n=1 Tax=Clostridium sp. TaxID=1506 RepID=UPI002FC5CF8B